MLLAGMDGRASLGPSHAAPRYRAFTAPLLHLVSWLLVAATVPACANSLSLPFIFDDAAVTTGNPAIRHFATA